MAFSPPVCGVQLDGEGPWWSWVGSPPPDLRRGCAHGCEAKLPQRGYGGEEEPDHRHVAVLGGTDEGWVSLDPTPLWRRGIKPPPRGLFCPSPGPPGTGPEGANQV